MNYAFFLSCFILILPLFGKAINYIESLVLYGGTIIFSFLAISYHPPKRLTKRFLIFETILILLSLVSTIFSKNIGYSYYAFFNFIFSLIILNLCLTFLNSEKLSKYLLFFSLFYSSIFLLNKVHFLPLSIDANFDNFILQIWGHSYLADLLIFSIPFLLYKIIHSSPVPPAKKYFYHFSLLFIFISTCLSYSRSAIIAISISTIYIVWPKISKYLKIPFVVAIICLAVFLNYQSFSQNLTQKSLDGKRPEYWQQAINAFLDRPIFGHGPGNFFYINKLYQSYPNSNTNYAHNSFLEYLCLNGLPFTLIIFSVIIFSLYFQHRRHSLNFAIGLTALINSFLDPSWNSIGIFCLSLFFIFSENPLIVLPSHPNPSKNSLFTKITLFIAFLFFLSKTLSDYLFVTHKPLASLYLDPFNLNPRLTLLPEYSPSSLSLYSHSSQVYRQLINTTSLPQSEAYYYQLFSLNPKENINDYSTLTQYYLDSNNFEKLKKLLIIVNQNLNPQNFTSKDSHSVAKISYKLALNEWQKQDYPSAIKYFQIATNFSQGWSHFYIELANAYWHIGQKDTALNLLTIDCQKFPSSIAHCQQYLDSYSENFLKPGTKFFSDTINSLP